MTSALVAGAVLAALALAIWFVRWSAYRQAKAEIRERLAQDEAEKADRHAEIAADKRDTADVAKRMRDGSF